MKKLLLLSVSLGALGLLPAHADAASLTFTTPDLPLSPTAPPGLEGRLWSAAAIAPVDTLAGARAYVAANPPDSLFKSTVVDYPNGPGATVFNEFTDFDTALGVDAPTLTNPAVGSNLVLNSILEFTGYLKIASDNTVLDLGVGSDGGSELVIQGTQVIDNDGIHAFPGAGHGPVDIEFASAGFYEMSILFFESQISEWGIEFYLNASQSGTPVPSSMLVVPEPSTLAVCGLLGALGAVSRRRRSG